MVRHKNFSIMLIIVLLAVLVSIGGVLSTWDYINDYSGEHVENIPTSIFLWQEVPTGDEGIIIEETGTKVADSLNNPNSELINAIESKEIFGMNTISSADNIHGAQMRNELGLDPTAHFLVEFKDPNTRVMYTTTVEIGGQSAWGAVEYIIPQGEWIYPVYRTIVVKDAKQGKWVQQSTQRGYAKSGEYVTFFSAAPFFDPTTWTRGKIGTEIGNAIYAYIGQNVKISVDSADEKAYFKIVVPKRNTQVNITVDAKSSLNLTILNANGKVVNNVTNNGKTYKFKSGARNSTYYIEAVGDTNINFTIS